ncbi:MAG: class II lanthipeptide, LchA2/BrtA2 family [Lachnospiraceae bacterium]|nr:class II lanthipeptide, LchA2/BrtA2 family [Lachnospiraceae bacterium]
MEKITGKITEAELEALAGEEVIGGATPVIVATIAFAGTTITVTLTAGACPTSACTKQCNK